MASRRTATPPTLALTTAVRHSKLRFVPTPPKQLPRVIAAKLRLSAIYMLPKVLDVRVAKLRHTVVEEPPIWPWTIS